MTTLRRPRSGGSRSRGRPSTSCAAASPASQSPSRVAGGRRTTRAGSGPLWPEPWLRYDRDTSSWRTCADSPPEGSESWSGTWPLSGTTLNGTAFRLPPLVHRTSGGASSSLPTTRLKERTEARSGRALWPTPVARDSGRSVEAHRAWRRRHGQNPEHIGSLTVLVKAIETGEADPPGLLATPTSADGRGGSGCSGRSGGTNLRTQVGGCLAPAFVERMMGFPDGWTETA